LKYIFAAFATLREIISRKVAKAAKNEKPRS